MYKYFVSLVVMKKLRTRFEALHRIVWNGMEVIRGEFYNVNLWSRSILVFYIRAEFGCDHRNVILQLAANSLTLCHHWHTLNFSDYCVKTCLKIL